MMSDKKCQCGATPRFRVVRGTTRGVRRPVRRERLECSFCGNMTATGSSREKISAEWETAAWCGMAGVRELSTEDGGARAEDGGRRTAAGGLMTAGRKAVTA